VEERDGDDNLMTQYCHGLDLICQNRSGTVSYYYYDGQHSTRSLTDDIAEVTDTYNYDAFGVLLNRSGATENNFLYTGEQFDPNVGFYYLRARYYNPEIGRFTTVDPWKGSIYDPVSLHKYLYCGNDPVDFKDWSGEFRIPTLSELTMSQVVSGILNTVRGEEFQIRFRVIVAAANIMGITLKTILPDEILKLKVNIAGTTLTVDQWLTGVNIATAIGSLTLSVTLISYMFQFKNVAAGIVAIVPLISTGVSLAKLPQFLEEVFDYKLF